MNFLAQGEASSVGLSIAREGAAKNAALKPYLSRIPSNSGVIATSIEHLYDRICTYRSS